MYRDNLQGAIPMPDDFNPSPPPRPQRPGLAHDPDADSAERTYALFNHLVGFLSASTGGLPFLGILATLLMWRLRAADSPFLDDHGREATNFQISLILYYLTGILFGVLTLGLGLFLAVPALIALWIISIIGQIRAALAANRGEFYRYPLCIRFINAPN